MERRDNIPVYVGGKAREKCRFRRIKKYIHCNLSADLSAAVVAEKFDLSISTLLHTFRNYSERTYQQYVADIRIHNALRIINKGGRVKEAMFKTGYKNRSTFNNAFKKRFKYTPGYFMT